MGRHIQWNCADGVVCFVDEGLGHREAARHFRVLPRFVNDPTKLPRETGSRFASPPRVNSRSLNWPRDWPGLTALASIAVLSGGGYAVSG
jgi:hypothetical protein